MNFKRKLKSIITITFKDNKFEYKNDKAANQINILLTGYTNINFNKED